MRRKISLTVFLVMVLMFVYSIIGWWKLHGAGAYRINTGLGKVLSLSWPFTAAFSLLGLLIFVFIALNNRAKKKKGDSISPASATESMQAENTSEENDATEILCDSGTQKKEVFSDNGKIEPAKPMMVQEESDSSAETEVMAEDETTLL